METWLRKAGLVCMVILMQAVCSRAGLAASMSGQEFSADMYSRSEGQTVQSKFYCGKDKIRMEMSGSIMITRLDKKVTLMIMPSEKAYMEQAINQKALPKTSKDMEGELERVSLGKEMVDGAQAEKFKVTYMEGSNRTAAYQWVLDSGFPVKMEAVDGAWSVEYKNVKIGPQPDELFEPPAGYNKMGLPFGNGNDVPSMDEIMSKAKSGIIE